MIWPTADEERLGLLADQLKLPLATNWRRHSIPLTVTFFVLTCVGVAAFEAFLNLIEAPYGPITLVASIGCAELLIQSYRFQRTGVENALWIAGPIAFIVSLPRQNRPEALLVFAAAFLIAGSRVRNPIFIAIAAIVVNVYAYDKLHSAPSAIAVGLGITALAALALLREWRRPTTEGTFDALVLVMPLAAYIIVASLGVLFAMVGVALLGLGVALRHRVLLWAGAIAIGIGGYDLQKRIDGYTEAKLIVAGIALVAIAAVLTNRLRRNSIGFVATETEDKLEALQMLGAIHVSSTPASSASQPEFKAGGGGFGGGGATGDV